MENPGSWGPVEKAVHKALQDHERAIERRVYGGSKVKVIAAAARQATLHELRRIAVETSKGDERLVNYVDALIARLHETS